VTELSLMGPAQTCDPRPFDAVSDAVETTLTAFLTKECAALVALDPALESLAIAVSDAVLSGGKRLRPQFAYWGWRANGGAEPVEAVRPALAALELLHAFALIHDDVMDRSAMRRGRPTTHRFLASAHSGAGLLGDASRFGQSGAILAGDLCLVWADRLMGQSLVDARRLAAARQAYDRMRIEAVAGQFLDILGDCAPDWSVERALSAARLKTAGYSVVQPLHFGAALAGPTDPSLAAAFTSYGIAVGEAFQLRDDLLGAFGDPAVTGKPVGDDLVQGKATVLLQLARARATAHQRAELDILQRYCASPAGNATPAAAQRLADLVRASGAADAVQQMIADRLQDSSETLGMASLPSDARIALDRLAQAVAWRSA
jgi:geranylgeranyl diphosphate synthase, type I